MTRKGARLNQRELSALEAELKAARIDVLIIDPFVSAHQVSENDNGAVDLVAKALANLAHRSGCAVELVHHTRELGGEGATSEAARGASALLAAARSGRALTPMTDDQRVEAGLRGDTATFFSITRDKANLAPAGNRTWRRIAPVELGNGDVVGAAEQWQWPDTFDGFSASDLLAVQKAIDGQALRYSDQAVTTG